MTSTVCHRFVQNAWKKERCSNCFKPREEHISLKREAPVSRRPGSKSRGIMKTTSTSTRRKRTVSFKVDLTEVIGFGGEDWEEKEDEEEDDDDEQNESSDDDCPSSTEEDKELDKLTKCNTEHNANITATATDRRRTFTQLMLGQPQKDSDGKKQTLLVSVTPFGQEENEKTPPKRFNKSISHIPIAKNKEILAEARPKVVLTSYSKNKDQNEVIPTKKEVKIEPEVAKPPQETNSVLKTKIEARKEPVPSPKEEKTVEKTKQIQIDVETIEQETNDDYEVVETVNEISVTERREIAEKTELVKSELKVQLSPTTKSAPKRESPILNTSPVPSSISPTPSNTSVDNRPTLNITLASSTTTSPVQPIPNTAPTPTTSTCATPTTTSPSQCPTTPTVSSSPPPHVSVPPTTVSPTTTPATNQEEDSGDSLGPSETREQAGEPDGRADPDVPCEPPALPRSPPPVVTPPPRNSFLHGVKGDKPLQVQTVPDKPKIPSKPEKPVQMVRSPSSELPPLPLSQTPNKRRAPNPPSLDDLPLDLDPIPIPLPPTPTQPSPPIYEDESPSYDIPVKKTSTPVITASVDSLVSEEKKKDKTKSKFSLRKFLRVGGSGSKNLEKTRLEEVKEKSVKPKLVIVHPLELNGSTVEVVTPPPNVIEEGLTFATPIKEILPPAPPPRNLSEKRVEEPKPPPKSQELLLKSRTHPSPPKCPIISDNMYANLGEVRSGLVPSKPQRTASMREREALLEQQAQIRRKPNLPQENLYERINPPRRHSDESNSGTKGFKPGSFSGSEPDLEIYSPCGSYYGSECEISEGGCSRPCRLRSRKGRSIVHRNLEDNYGAVVVANHEALAQVLEHLHQQTSIQPALRGLQTAPMLRWSDFSVVDTSPGVVVGRRAFHHALWGAHHVTLAVSKDQCFLNKPTGLGAFSLVPVTEFNDLVGGKFVPGGEQDGVAQASVAVLPWVQVDTIQSFGATIKSKNSVQPQSTEINRDACFTLLQFVNSLKSLQAQGIEEVPLSLSNFILCHDVDRDTHHRLCLLQGFSEEVCRTDEKEKLGSLCQSATAALEELFPQTKLAILIKTLLKKESAMSLSQVKSILEFSLWGPSDVALGVPIKDRELALQRWLDLERATVLHGLVGTRVQLSVLEECHLLFLVRSSAKMMCEASLLLETNGVS